MDLELQKLTSVEEIEKLISNLQIQKGKLLINNLNNNKEVDKDKGPLQITKEDCLDWNEVLDDEDITQWLVPTEGPPIPIPELEEKCRDFIDLELINSSSRFYFELKRFVQDYKMKECIESGEKFANKMWIDKVWKGVVSQDTPPRPRVMSSDSAGSEGSVDLPLLASSPLPSRFSARNANNNAKFLDGFEDGVKNNINSSFIVETPTRQIDTRTYTRPKNKKPVMSFANTTFTQEDEQGNLDSDEANELNNTFTKERGNQSGDNEMLNKTISYVLEPPGRRVIRHETFIATKPAGNLNEQNGLNTTFSLDDNKSVDGTSPGNQRVPSLDEIHKKAQMQEQTLRNFATPERTLKRKDTRLLASYGNKDQRPSLDSSQETYSIEISPGSSISGLSSPRGGQSTDNLHTTTSQDAFRRSMPNLAYRRYSTGPAGYTGPHPGSSGRSASGQITGKPNPNPNVTKKCHQIPKYTSKLPAYNGKFRK